jgi:uncharacterized membrane protein
MMMNQSNSNHPYLESLLAYVLQYGSWAASATIGVGLALSLISAHAPPFSAMKIVTVGLALFILLPVFRVFIMFVVFLKDRDYKFSAIAALVLAILVLGVVVGLRAAKMVAG